MQSVKNALPASKGLSPEKLGLLELLLKKKGINTQVNRAIPRRTDTGPWPLSFGQQRLWFLDQLEPGSPAYNIPAAIRLSGPLHVTALVQCLNELVRRHETLRTVFTMFEGQPAQVVNKPQPVGLIVIDLQELSDDKRELHALKIAAEEARRPFDITREPPFRTLLIRLSDEEHIILVSMHHIASDLFSRMILVRELATLYQSFNDGLPSPLAELPIQYADYAVWQREWLQGEVLERQLNYWKQQLSGALAVLELPTDRIRPAVLSYSGASLLFTPSHELTAALEELARAEGVTLPMLLMAVFQTLLFRYSKQSAISVGMPVAGRSRKETEGLIGFFVNTLVLRTDFSGEPTFRELLKRVREVCLGAYAHQDVPFEKLVEELDPARALSHTPLFQAMLVLQNVPGGGVSLPGVELGQVAVENNTAKFDLTLTAMESARGLLLMLEYRTQLFEKATAERMLQHLEMLLGEVVRDVNQRVDAIPLLTDGEREQSAKWSRREREFTSDKCLHELFEARVESGPQSAAVKFEEHELSYQELNERANQLAHHLQGLGIGPEARVGLCVERSLEMVVGLLGIVKAGAGYVPIDPAYPQERLAFMMEDAEVSVLLTQERLLAQLPEQSRPVLCLDRDWNEIAKNSGKNLRSGVTPENLAYIIYTSGSTGVPKGSLITHHNVLRLFAGAERQFNLNAQDVWTLFHSYAFDFSVWEIWGALLYGGRLVVVPYFISRQPEAFNKLLRREQVTVLNQTPSAFRQLLRAEAEAGSEANDQKLAVRLVIFGGEALEVSSLRRWYEQPGRAAAQLVNMYGITETTVHVTQRELQAGDLEQERQGSPIGRGLSDLDVYVLGRNLELMPVGVTGELYIGGAGLARGYWRRAALTAERFIPHPYSSQPGERLYRTGDLARYSATGELEYMGRIDEQVKVRGYRIELGEVEAVLNQHPAVAECVVMARADEASVGARLIGYVVNAPGHTVNVSDLRSYLQGRLPDYMIPAQFVVLEALPLTTNGKVDRQALPAPDQSRPELQVGYVAPGTPDEEMLVSIFQEVLKVERVGIHDNFFELGGHSLLATQAVARIRETMQVQLPLQNLFETPTVAGVANAIFILRQQQPLALTAGKGSPDEAVDLQPFGLISIEDRLTVPEGIVDAYPLTKLQAGMLFHSEYHSDSMLYQNINGFILKNRFDLQKLQAAVQQLAAEHAILRTSFDLSRFSEPLQLVHEEAEAPIGVDDLRELPATEQ